MPQEIDTERARQGKTLHQMRFVLGISTALGVIALGAVFLYFAA